MGKYADAFRNDVSWRNVCHHLDIARVDPKSDCVKNSCNRILNIISYSNNYACPIAKWLYEDFGVYYCYSMIDTLSLLDDDMLFTVCRDFYDGTGDTSINWADYPRRYNEGCDAASDLLHKYGKPFFDYIFYKLNKDQHRLCAIDFCKSWCFSAGFFEKWDQTHPHWFDKIKD